MITIYKASAGSGKTFRLTEQYLTLLLGEKNDDGSYSLRKDCSGDHHRHILAITFTNKATEEMKRRIVHELAVLAGMEPGWKKKSKHEGNLINIFGCTEADLKKAAKESLIALLYDFSYFNVSTIDAFFQTILRAFAREAELTGNYELELDENFVINQSVAQLLSDISNEDAATSRHSKRMEWIIKYMESLAREGHSFNVFNRKSKLYETLIYLIKGMLDENLSINFETMGAYLSDQSKLQSFLKAIHDKEIAARNDAMTVSRSFLDKFASEGLDPAELLNANFYKAMLQWSGKGYSDKLSSTLESAAEDPSKTIKKAAAKKAGIAPDDALYTHAQNTAATIVRSFNAIATLRITRANIFMLGLLGDVLEYLRKYCSDNNTFLLSDTNDLINRIIGDDEVPFIYERIGLWLNHYLIDEFQDTSEMQWRNLIPLIKESLGWSHDNLIIGDEKQCIYRFRNSNPELLHSGVQKSFPRQHKEEGNLIEQNTNWRSSADVVRFNNTIFSALGKVMGFEETYSNVVQQVADKNLDRKGYVKITRIDDDDFPNRSLAVMDTEISRQLLAGYEPQDIVILTRTRNQAKTVISHIYKQIAAGAYPKKVNIISDDSLEINRAPSVRFIISMLRVLTSPDFSTERNVSARRIAVLINKYEYLRSHSDISPSELLEKAIKDSESGSLEDSYGEDFEAAKSTGLQSVVENIIGNYISPEAREAENMFITAFTDLVSDFCEKGEGDIQSFLRWWDFTGCKSTLSSPRDKDALRVMTIHKSKGLEFRCVHIPFLLWPCINDRDVSWFFPKGLDDLDPAIVPPMLPLKGSKKMIGTPYEEQYNLNNKAQLLDELNATYVAFTRAIDELIIQYTPGKSTTIGNFTDQAVEMCTPSFCSSLWDSYKDGLDDGAPCVFIDGLESDGEGVFTVGAPLEKAVVDEEEEQSVLEPKGKPIEMPPYSSSKNEHIWKLLSLEAEDEEDDDDEVTEIDSAPRERGNMLHAIMAKVRHTADVALAVNRFGSRHGLSLADIDDITRYLQDQVSRDDVKRWFEGFTSLLTERKILIGDSSRRPDRIVWTADGSVEVIDYKFGEEHPREYNDQVVGYLALLRKAGIPDPKGYIWYLDSGKIVTV